MRGGAIYIHIKSRAGSRGLYSRAGRERAGLSTGRDYTTCANFTRYRDRAAGMRVNRPASAGSGQRWPGRRRGPARKGSLSTPQVGYRPRSSCIPAALQLAGSRRRARGVSAEPAAPSLPGPSSDADDGLMRPRIWPTLDFWLTYGVFLPCWAASCRVFAASLPALPVQTGLFHRYYGHTPIDKVNRIH